MFTGVKRSIFVHFPLFSPPNCATKTHQISTSRPIFNHSFSTDEYKTKKMVFRKIPKGTYQIGHSSVSYNTAHNVTFPKDYYFAIFQMTVAQYNRLNLASSPGTTKTRLDNISWNTLRGSAGAAAKPTSGPIATIASKTGLAIDLPTHAMWETAVRAKLTTMYLTGNSLTSAYYDYAYVGGNGTTQEVGAKKPNSWGIYDGNGLTFMWMRDVLPGASSVNLSTYEKALKNGFVPVTSSTTGYASYRIVAGGNYTLAADKYGAFSHTCQGWSNVRTVASYADANHTGARLAVYPADYYPNASK